jgi:RNA-binding protein
MIAPSSPGDEPRLRDLKSRAQLLSPVVRIGIEGATEPVAKALSDALDQHELVKVKFVAQKEEKKRLIRWLEAQTGSRLVQQVGHTATYFRARRQTAPAAP